MLIGRYAERFGRNPDDVFGDTSFNTVINFTVAWKEHDEFHERFHFIDHEINAQRK